MTAATFNLGALREWAGWPIRWLAGTTPTEVTVSAAGSTVVAALLARAPRSDEALRWRSLGEALRLILALSDPEAAHPNCLLAWGVGPHRGAVLIGVDEEGKAPRLIAVLARADGSPASSWDELTATSAAVANGVRLVGRQHESMRGALAAMAEQLIRVGRPPGRRAA